MSANRKPSKATDEEIANFHEKTKDIISKTGLYYDPITKKHKKALKQDGKSKGSGRDLIKDTKFTNYLKEVAKRMGDDDADDIRARVETAKAKGFSTLQKERKLFGAAGGAAVVGDAAAQKALLDKAKKETPPVPTNVVKKKLKIKKKPKLSERPGGDKLQKMKTAGETKDETPIAQTKLKKRGGSKLADVRLGSEEWYQQQVMKARHDAVRKGGDGEEGMKVWRREQQKKYGLPPTATKRDIMERADDERNRISRLQKAQINEESYKQGKKDDKEAEASGRNIQSGNLRKKRVQEGATEQKRQEDKIENVVLDNDAPAENPLSENANIEETVDVEPDGGFADEDIIDLDEVIMNRGNVRGSGETREEDVIPARSNPNTPGRRKGQEFYPEPTQEPPPIPEAPDYQEEAQRGAPPIPEDARPNNINMDITDTRDREVEVDKESGLGFGDAQRSFVSPAAERVSMERNRMKYSPLRLYEECKAFVRIYSDDIKTNSWKKIKDDFKKVSSETKVTTLRELHRRMEEEVIEYYQGRQGVRLGVIIDPAVLGININQLQSMMNPSIPMNTGNSVRDIGTQQARLKAKEVHYNLGGYKHATGAMMEEGKNIDASATSNQHKHARIKVPETHRQRYLFKPSVRSRNPVNLKIRSGK